MITFDKDTLVREYESKFSTIQAHLDDLARLVVASNDMLEGNCFYVHGTLMLYPELFTKQSNLYWCGKQSEMRICEIGLNAGHSAMLMLLGSQTNNTPDPLQMTIFDIGHHRYTRPCFNYLQSKFSQVKFEYVEGDSTVTMPEWIRNHKDSIGTYDVVHVDGGHDLHCISNDMKNTDLLVRLHGIVIIDDTNVGHINDQVNMYLATGNYAEICVNPTSGYPHRIIQRIK